MDMKTWNFKKLREMLERWLRNWVSAELTDKFPTPTHTRQLTTTFNSNSRERQGLWPLMIPALMYTLPPQLKNNNKTKYWKRIKSYLGRRLLKIQKQCKVIKYNWCAGKMAQWEKCLLCKPDSLNQKSYSDFHVLFHACKHSPTTHITYTVITEVPTPTWESLQPTITPAPGDPTPIPGLPRDQCSMHVCGGMYTRTRTHTHTLFLCVCVFRDRVSL